MPQLILRSAALHLSIAGLFEPVSKLFDTDGFYARWNCGDWSRLHGWTHILSDLAIASAYSVIPFALLTFWWKKRHELAFPKLLWLFSAFIFSCGATHLVDAIIFYHPVYRFSGLLKLITGIVSWITAISLIRLAPQAFELPGLKRINHELEEQLKLRRIAEENLERSNRDLQAFTGMVTHDLKNPVSAAIFMSHLAREAVQSGDTEHALSHLDATLESIRRMENLITELHSQAMAQKKAGSACTVDLNEILNLTRQDLAPRIDQNHVTLHVENLPSVQGNRTLLLQLFTNLIENAIKYRSEADPVIQITSRRTATHNIVTITDNGRGILPGDRDKVFETEVRGTNVQSVIGSGLGLALCRRIMNENGGTIVTYPADQGGSVFELEFPL